MTVTIDNKEYLVIIESYSGGEPATREHPGSSPEVDFRLIDDDGNDFHLPSGYEDIRRQIYNYASSRY